MSRQSNKPDGSLDGKDGARPAGEQQAVKNQGEAEPEDYPERATGDPRGGTTGR